MKKPKNPRKKSKGLGNFTQKRLAALSKKAKDKRKLKASLAAAEEHTA
jgi:hypothetical protein